MKIGKNERRTEKSELAKGELMNGRDICKNPKGYIRNKT